MLHPCFYLGVDDAFKLHVKLGGHEYNAEGPKESVESGYQRWLDALSALRDTVGPPDKPPPEDHGYERPGGLSRKVSDRILDRVFNVDHAKKRVSLTIVPKGTNREADALILLLYGFSVFLEEHAVLGGRLLEAGRMSGLMLDRVDRALAVHSDKLLPGGYRRGKTYGLNNPGKTYAEEMLTKIMES